MELKQLYIEDWWFNIKRIGRKISIDITTIASTVSSRVE